MKWLVPAAALGILAFLGYKLFVAKGGYGGFTGDVKCNDCAGKTPSRAPAPVTAEPISNVLKLDKQIATGMGFKKGMM